MAFVKLYYWIIKENGELGQVNGKCMGRKEGVRLASTENRGHYIWM